MATEQAALPGGVDRTRAGVPERRSRSTAIDVSKNMSAKGRIRAVVTAVIRGVTDR